VSAGGARDTGEGRAFDPPYELGGQLAVLVGVLRGDVQLPSAAARAGWRPVAFWGRSVAAIVASHYDDPPRERPVPYREAILALLVRRDAHLATLPISMQLDRMEPTSDGLRHYSFPKRYEPELRLSITAGGAVRIEAEDLRVEALPRGRWSQKVLGLPCVLFTVGTRALTAVLPVLGTAQEPHRRAIVALRPKGSGWPLKASDVRFARACFRVFWAQAFDRCSTWLGPPSTLDDH
jgi:hypothetical protein